MMRTLRELWRYRELLFSLVTRDVKVRYKQTVLGVAWSIIQPLSMMLVFTFVFSRVAKVPTDGLPYPVFSYCALVPWTLFVSSLSFATPSLAVNSDLVRKIYFPREIFPMAAVCACFVDFLVASLLFVGMIAFYHIPVTASVLWVAPLLAIQLLLTIGIALLASGSNVYFRDVKYIVPLGLQLLLFLTPVIYTSSAIPEAFRWLYQLNPMAGIIEGYRSVVLHGTAPDLQAVGMAAVISIVLFFGSYAAFKRMERSFADVI